MSSITQKYREELLNAIEQRENVLKGMYKVRNQIFILKMSS